MFEDVAWTSCNKCGELNVEIIDGMAPSLCDTCEEDMTVQFTWNLSDDPPTYAGSYLVWGISDNYEDTSKWRVGVDYYSPTHKWGWDVVECWADLGELMPDI